MKNLITAIGLFMGITMITSCIDEFDFRTDLIVPFVNLGESAELAIPLVDASFTVDELLSMDSTIDKNLIIDETNYVSMQFSFEFDAFPAVDFFNGDYGGISLPYYTDNLPPQILELGFDKLLNQGEVYLPEPKITISVVNYWNIPTRFKFSEFNYYQENNSPAIPVSGSLLSQWILIDQPLSPEIRAVTDIVLDSTNTNIDSVISALPHHLSFGADYETIPGGIYTINSSTTDSVLVKVDVPLNMKATNLLFTDTIDFNLADKIGQDTSNIDSLQLNLVFNNGFPIALSTQVYFLDSTYITLDSISDTKIEIPGGKVANGLVTESTITPVIKIPIDKERMKKIMDSKYLILSATFNTVNSNLNQTVKIYSNYTLGLKVGALVKLQLKL
jgi:hypothetical protein